jgi:hypothetical protein
VPVLLEGVTVRTGHAELWIPDERTSLVFAAPDLLPHYVAAHGYRPPDEFIDVVRGMPLKRYQNWDSSSFSTFLINMAYRWHDVRSQPV